MFQRIYFSDTPPPIANRPLVPFVFRFMARLCAAGPSLRDINYRAPETGNNLHISGRGASADPSIEESQEEGSLSTVVPGHTGDLQNWGS